MENNVDLLGMLTFARADFKPEMFDTLILQKGHSAIWEKSILCSCYDSTSGQPDFQCPVCGGKGYIYFDAKTTRVLATSINGRKEQERPGLDEKGYSYITTLSTDFVGFRDRFTFPDFKVRFTQTAKRSMTSEIDTLRYPILDVICARKLYKTYYRGLDFDLVPDNPTAIQWRPEADINPGDSYSVLIIINPVYIVMNPIHELRGAYVMARNNGIEKFVQLPQQFQVKREDFTPNTKPEGDTYYGY